MMEAREKREKGAESVGIGRKRCTKRYDLSQSARKLRRHTNIERMREHTQRKEEREEKRRAIKRKRVSAQAHFGYHASGGIPYITFAQRPRS